MDSTVPAAGSMTDVDAAAGDVPLLELDVLLAQLVDRAQDVLRTQGRLRSLLRANRMIVGDLALPVVLRSIVQAACELVRAPYGALGVIAPDGGLEQFIHIGMDEATVQQIGQLPSGKGLLGALIDHPQPIRLQRIADDSRSIGFPANHPAMGSFLGVPITVRNEVYGNLYLTGHDGSEVSQEDEELILSLATTAGVAIDNARLYAESSRRQVWLRASTEITRQLLSNVGEEPLQVIARRLQEIAEADAVNVVLPTADGTRLMVEVATGAGAQQIAALSYPVANTVAQDVLLSGRPIMIADVTQHSDHVVYLSEVVDLGPLMVLPLLGSHRSRGALLVGRLVGREQFTAADLEMASTFANHAALALELADARADQERITLLEDHQRIARDLHDHVIQRLFGAGLTVQAIAGSLHGTQGGVRLSEVVNEIDQTIKQIRSSIFALSGPLGPGAETTTVQVSAVVASLVGQLGLQPRLDFVGPVDVEVSRELLADLCAVVREGLTNVARHAQASRVTVRLEVRDRVLSLDITDDGRGLGMPIHRSGLANLEHRAQAHGGSMAITAPEADADSEPTTKGTSLRWTVPLS